MTSLRRLVPLASTAAVLLLGAVQASPAAAAEPWWGINTNVRPATIHPGGEGTISAVASNLGNDNTSGPSSLSITLPEGVSIVEEEGAPQVQFWSFTSPISGHENLGLNSFLGQILGYCSASAQTATCTTESSLGEEFDFAPLAPYEFLEVRVKVKDEGVAPGAAYEAVASGGGATTLTRSRPLPLGASPPVFGAEAYELRPEAEGGAIETRAGSHPYQLTTTFNLNQEAEDSSGEHVAAPRIPRNLNFDLPPGQIGNASALPRCSAAEFAALFSGSPNACPADTAIGVATITIDEPIHLGISTWPVPLVNLAPAHGEPARFGFEVLGSPVILDTSVRSGPGEDYGVTVSTSNITQIAGLIGSTVTFWGAPGDSSHDASRGWGCLVDAYWVTNGHNDPPFEPCEPSSQQNPPAFLTLPTDCHAPFVTSARGESWTDPTHPVAATFPPFTYSLEDGFGNLLSLTACNQIPFDPRVSSEPTSDAATSPTGLSFDINFEDDGLTSPSGRAQSQMKKAVVTLPQGFTTNPSVAEGLKACSEAEYEAATLELNSGCASESKVGEVTIQSPLVQQDQIVKGGLYVAQQGSNPNHNLLTLYMIVREPEIGVLIRQALKVTPDPATGQLTTEVDNAPQLPFSHFHLFFRPGQRAPLVTPPSCGTYTVEADLYPWSSPTQPVHRESSFEITQGPEGQPCPSGGVPPFHPNLEAGTTNNAAGTYSPFVTKITRKDSEQEITHFSIKLPPGVIGKLAGVSSCSDAQIAAAKAREREGGGQEELNSPSCPANSEIGHSLVGSGVGNVLAYAPGKLYLAGPYHGSNLSLVSITAAKVGPFDLGTVVVRFALRIDPETAEVFVDAQGSDPIPHIVDGIPVHLRDIRAYVSRPEFTLNPTGCDPTSTASTVLGSGLNFASEADDQPVTVSSPFQAADCANLGFKPKLKLSLLGGTKRGDTPKFKAVLTARPGDANIGAAQVTLPHSEFLDNAHIKTICTRVVFAQGNVPGENCPADSIYGYAKAVTPILSEPVEGPVFLRSSSHQLPDLVAALHNKQVDIDLDGHVEGVKGGIRNTFEAVPDAPVTKFTLEMQGGKKGLLENSTNLCAKPHHATAAFTGHNGKVENFKPLLAVKCGKHGKKKSHHGKHH